MARKWVEGDKYIGSDRRKGGKRLLTRRRKDETTEPPSLSALLRRLRIALNDASPAGQKRALQLFSAARKMADELTAAKCSAALGRAEQAFRDHDIDDADALVAQAMSYAG
jgi:hypothetical protein